MTNEVQIEIGTASDENIETAALLFGSTFNATFDWLKQGVQSGLYEANTVRLNGVDRYLLVHHVNDQKLLHVNAAAQLTAGKPLPSEFDLLVKAMVKLAREKLCRGIQGISHRRAMVEKLIEHGFALEGVCVYYPF